MVFGCFDLSRFTTDFLVCIKIALIISAAFCKTYFNSFNKPVRASIVFCLPQQINVKSVTYIKGELTFLLPLTSIMAVISRSKVKEISEG